MLHRTSIAILLTCSVARATTIAPPQPLEKRVAEADKVFVGVLVDRKLQPGDWCHANLRVTRAIKGAQVGELVPVVWRPEVARYDAQQGQEGLAVLKYRHQGRYWLRADTFEDVKLTEEAIAVMDKMRLKELDAYWAEVSRAVRQGDYEGYRATCHPEGVLVAGTKDYSQPLPDALARWQQDFVATKSGKVKSNVEFRFSQRLGDETTAHETGMFHYSAMDEEGKGTDAYIHLEALLVRRNGKWLILMEYQKSAGTQEEWEALD